MLARNHRDGPDWIPATTVEVLGPATYIVDTDSGLRWKRHTDQMKNWLSATPRVAPEPEPEPTGTDSDDATGDPDYLSPENNLGTGADESDSAAPVSSPVEETGTSPTDGNTPTDSTSDQPERRYPTRVRQPPIRYDPTVAGTFSVLVC